MAERLDARLLGGLLGLIVHDLRNPLSALHSNASFLQSASELSHDDVREALDDVSISCEALNHIIDNLELLSLSLRDEHKFEKQSFPLADLLEEAVKRARAFATSYGVTLELVSDLEVGLKLSANREMLERAAGNLLMNAIQHAGGTGSVRVSVRVEPGMAVIAVSDTGPRLNAQLGGAAFTAQGQLASKGLVGGRYSRGAGLFAAELAAEAAGVTLGIAQHEGSGNRFELRVPTLAPVLRLKDHE